MSGGFYLFLVLVSAFAVGDGTGKGSLGFAYFCTMIVIGVMIGKVNERLEVLIKQREDDSRYPR